VTHHRPIRRFGTGRRRPVAVAAAGVLALLAGWALLPRRVQGRPGERTDVVTPAGQALAPVTFAAASDPDACGMSLLRVATASSMPLARTPISGAVS
jgi:hypothetical protein